MKFNDLKAKQWCYKSHSALKKKEKGYVGGKGLTNLVVMRKVKSSLTILERVCS